MPETRLTSGARGLPPVLLQVAAMAALAVACVAGEVSPRRAPAGDGGVTDATPACPTGTAEMQKNIFAARCAGAGCHGSDSPALALDLVSPDLEARLLGAPSIGCRGEKLLLPGHPEQSELFRKVAHTTPECGARMPLGGAFADGEIECLRLWIMSLVPTDGGAPDGAPTADAGSDAGPDAPSGLSCPTGQTVCDQACVDLSADNANCGTCGKTCAPGTTCANRMCGCPDGRTLCDGSCVDSRSSNLHCGGCGQPCGAIQTCTAGACSCSSGLTGCGGACVDLQGDWKNCGACGISCDTSELCSGGTCVRGACPGGTTNCDGACVDQKTSRLHCGGCGNVCPSGETCAGGSCSCGDSTISCAGVCVDSSTDALNCGGCGKVCPAGGSCSGGACRCSAGLTGCGASCVNTATDSKHCGACGQACSSGASCLNGVCTASCGSGTTFCGGACVNTSSDILNCGGCGKACAVGERCISGACIGCGPTVSFASQVQPIFNGSCTSNCHGGNRPAGGLSLASGAAYAELINVTSSCKGRKQVAPGSPDASYIINKLTGVDMCAGSVMPKMGGELSPAQIDLIRGWICQGAPNN
jgi:hypothetical protein